MSARAVVAATGSFGRPNRPTLPGLDSFTGTLLHATEYRAPEPFARQRVVVVGAGNSAVQVATELATRARVSLTSRAPVAWLKQHPLGRDLHFWLKRHRAGHRPARPLPARSGHHARHRRRPLPGRARRGCAGSAPDVHRHQRAQGDLAGRHRRGRRRDRPGHRLQARPRLPRTPGRTRRDGRPRHRDGISVTHPRLAYVGLEWQRSLSSASLRGVGRDAQRITRRLAAHLARS